MKIHLLAIVLLAALHTTLAYIEQIQTCSWNGIPTSRNLDDCTWYNPSTCCTFDQSQTIHNEWDGVSGSGANQTIPTYIRNALISKCLSYMHLFICNPCSPQQSTFFTPPAPIIGGGKLNLCETFCNSMYSACGAVIYNGGPVSTQFSSGTDFCTRGLQQTSQVTIEVTSSNCFNAGSTMKLNYFLALAAAILALLFL